ncbi:MAG: 50S ribosomal protein L25 [Polyangiaceae bacterium]
MMEIQKLSAQPRKDHGKGHAGRLRAAGKIPAVAYGKKLPTMPISVDPKALKTVLAGQHGRNSVVELAVEGDRTITAMVREYSHHPVSRDILHADFIQVHLGEPVDTVVPLRLTGKPKGVVLGGILMQVFRALPTRCPPEKIPVVIEADCTELELNTSIKVSQLKLPEGVTIRLPQDQTIAAVVAPEKATEEEKGPGGAPAAAAAAGGKPAAAAPAAAAGKAPAAAAAAKPAADKKKK